MARIGLLFLVVVYSIAAFSQATPTRIRSVTSLPATCQPGDGVQQTDFVTLITLSASVLYRCSSTNTWTAMMDLTSATWTFDPTNGIFTLNGPGTTAIYLGQDSTCTWSAPAGTYFQICNLLGTLNGNPNNTGNFAIPLLDSSNHLQATNGNPQPQNCGTTTTCTATAMAGSIFVIGKVTLSTGTATITGISPTYTSSTSYFCWANDITTPSNGAKAIPATASSITVTGTGSDVVVYGCFGN